MQVLTGQCGNGASRTAQGKAAATRALGGGGGAATLAAAESAMVASAEARGATPEAIARLQQGFAARVGGAQVATAQAAVDAAQARVDATAAKLATAQRSLRSLDDFNKVNDLRDTLVADNARLQASKQKLEAAKKSAGVRENFTAGKPIPDAEMRRPPTAAETQVLGDRYKLKDPRGLTGDRRDAAQARINEYNAAKAAAPGLTQAEFLSIQSYTKGSGYIGINGAARGLQTDPRSPQAQQQRIEARLVHQALDKVPKYQGEVRRDTQIPTKDFNRDYKTGNVIRFNGVTSTTSDLSGRNTAQYGTQKAADATRGQIKESNKAANYDSAAAKVGVKTLPRGEATQVEYRIQSKSGRNISSISRAAAEREVALQHGWQGKITKVESYTNSSGATVQRVYLDEV